MVKITFTEVVVTTRMSGEITGAQLDDLSNKLNGVVESFNAQLQGFEFDSPAVGKINTVHTSQEA